MPARPRSRRLWCRLAPVALVAGLLGLVPSQLTPAGASSQSISTTTDGVVLSVHPAAPDPVNCNQFAAKEHVWLSNLPHALPDGDYYLAVTPPGSQSGPNDDNPALLSTDTHLDRAFRVTGGTLTSLGTHAVSNGRIQVAPFLDTPNSGGVYVVSVCRLAEHPAPSSACTHDAFKVGASDPAQADAPVVVKDAAGTYERTYAWTVTKTADQDTVHQTGGTVTVGYDVTVSHDDGTVSDVVVSGTITVFNPNTATVVADVTDELSNGTACTVVDGAGAVLEPGDNTFAYTCALAGLPDTQLDNTARVVWADQAVGQAPLAAGSASFVLDGVGFAETTTDECVQVGDTLGGDLGQVCVGGDNPGAWGYTIDFPVDDPACAEHANTATAVTNDTATPSSASAVVTVCQVPLDTGAKTIGFWQNKNGQGIITDSGVQNGACAVGTYLRTFAPFADLSASASCAQVATWVKGVIAKATGSTMNTMLKAQMLATALNVHFTGPGSTSATRKFIPGTALGGILVDLTEIWGGQDVSAAFGGATTMKVSAMLAWAAAQSSAGGGTWYGNVKPVQTKAKDAFDAMNNQAVYAP